LECPICKTGKIISHTTEKGKTYYACTHPDCKFISWGKPYHFPCPLCRNPFLIEYADSSGKVGLKCPRATCSYRQNTLDAPENILKFSSAVSSGADQSVPESKNGIKRVVRRRVVRRKR